MRKTILAATLFISAAAFAQQDFSKVEVKAQKVAGTVYMLTGAGGNIGVSVGDDGIVIVDDQYAPLAPKIKEALKAIADKPIKFVLNTHYHGDHTGGNETFGREAPVIAQTNVRKRLASGSHALGRDVPPAPKGALPVVTFDDKVSIFFNGEEIKAAHFPHGHTDGDSVIHFSGSNVVHMGDDFFNGTFPFIDVENGGGVKGMIAAGEKILSTMPDDVKIIPGHGPLSDKAGLKAFDAMLRETSAAVQKQIDEGKSLDDIQKAKPLAEWAEKWGKGFINPERFTAMLFDSIKAGR